jgi:putative DNA primase/helicase
MTTKISTKEAAKGKWPGILKHFGIEDEYLQDVHGPCPACGGTDRYRFDDRNGNGDFYCNHCGAGDGFDLLERARGMDFAAAAKAIDEIVGNIQVEKPKEPPHDPEKARAILNEIWKGSRPNGQVVTDYLKRRGLSVIPPGFEKFTLRSHPGLKYSHNGAYLGAIPAMLAMFVDLAGKPQGIHRTFMLGDSLGGYPRKKTMKATTLSGCAIRLWPHGETLGLAEGIETAIAAHELSSLPVWATYSAGNLRVVDVPPEVKNVVIFADNDINGAGQVAADELRVRLTREGKQVDVQVAPTLDTDWLDYLNAKK